MLKMHKAGIQRSTTALLTPVYKCSTLPQTFAPDSKLPMHPSDMQAAFGQVRSFMPRTLHVQIWKEILAEGLLEGRHVLTISRLAVWIKQKSRKCQAKL